jgi:hypothetical protein
VSAEFWAIIGLAAVVWISGIQIVAKLEKLEEALRRPRKVSGEDEVLEELRIISGHLYGAELDRMAEDRNPA